MTHSNDLPVEAAAFEYVGFWPRFTAFIVDSLLVIALLGPIFFALYGKAYFTSLALHNETASVVINYVFPAIVVIIFWLYKSATPGKMVVKAVIVDAKTLGKPAKWQLLVRYLGYYVSTIPLCLGLVWVAVDEKKQGWHDKLAGTVVIRYTK